MKNEHDQNRDFPHTHSIRLPAQESHKQGNQIFAVTQRKELACNRPTRAVPFYCARWLPLPAAHSRPNLGSSRGPRSAPPPAAGGAAGHADQQHLSRPGIRAPITCPAAQARTRCLPAPRIKSQTKPAPLACCPTPSRPQTCAKQIGRGNEHQHKTKKLDAHKFRSDQNPGGQKEERASFPMNSWIKVSILHLKF